MISLPTTTVPRKELVTLKASHGNVSDLQLSKTFVRRFLRPTFRHRPPPAVTSSMICSVHSVLHRRHRGGATRWKMRRALCVSWRHMRPVRFVVERKAPYRPKVQPPLAAAMWKIVRSKSVSSSSLVLFFLVFDDLFSFNCELFLFLRVVVFSWSVTQEELVIGVGKSYHGTT